ncbi:DsbA family protein [Novosphingobium sp.]|uniref:DsbA family protein n=1 Tax=Novosphingobium sp. TaxID=1874826 RepID=UPI00273529CA|nr:DsbA family protein [Novosphingobium sp.]MDP3907581.1 DsbA family protein [Novosphingobium sp.]
MTETKSRSILFALVGLILLIVGGIGGWLFESRRTEETVKRTILENPEILPQAMEELQRREAEKQLTSVGDKLFEPFPGSVLGNPQGTVTLVEFTDFACTYCRTSVPDVDALIKEFPQLKVVVRQLPILSPQSAEAARWSLAAAEQGRYAQFHHAMFAAGRPDAQTIAAAAQTAGLDMDRARKALADPLINAELSGNLDFARALGIDGTPSWVIGEQLMSGAVGREALAKAIRQAGQS